MHFRVLVEQPWTDKAGTAWNEEPVVIAKPVRNVVRRKPFRESDWGEGAGRQGRGG